jgi:hypothetical protein
MLSDFSDSLTAASWAAMLSILGYAAWVRKAWPRIEIKTEWQRVGDIEVTDIAIYYSGWGWQNADHSRPPKTEWSIIILKKKRKN